MIKTVSITVVDVTNRILVLKRSLDKNSYPGKWDILSGKLEKDETALECFYRELFEETAINAPSNIEAKKPYIFKEDDRQWLVHPFRCLIPSDVPVKLNGEHTEYCWMTKTELLALDHATPLPIDLAVWE